MLQILSLLGLPILFYVLYITGLMPIRSMIRLKFIGNTRAASVSKSTGYIKQIFRVKETKVYNFFLEMHLSNGSIRVEILDSSKKIIAILDKNNTSVDIDLVKHKRYYVIVRFENVTGNYRIYY